MRIVRGIEQGRVLLTRQPGYEEPELTAAAAQRTAKVFGAPLSASQAVRRIVSDVRKHGDSALWDYAKRIDQTDLAEIEVPADRWGDALNELSADLVDAMQAAAARIKAYAQASMPQGWHDGQAGYGERIVPIERVGLYVPGGTAEYPSTVLMSAIPAKVAGVAQLILCTPWPSAAALAAAHIAGVDRVFALGGAQAVAAMAFGTESVPKVDKICGPGNIFVSIAKREVYGHVDIDGLYGPTETVVIADATADPALCAADLLAQAEHDEMASPVFLTTDPGLAERVSNEIEAQLRLLERQPVARASVERQGIAVVVDTIAEAIDLANAFAPEHMCLLVENPAAYAPLVRNAGGLFLGEQSPEVMGDYVAGPSHVMPTAGTARYASYLGVHQFLRHMPVVSLSEATLREAGPAAASIARTEGLTAHARAVEMRLEGGRG